MSRGASRASAPLDQNHRSCRRFLSGANRDRTGDLLLAKQALSQLSYGPFEPRVYANTPAAKGIRTRLAAAGKDCAAVPVESNAKMSENGSAHVLSSSIGARVALRGLPARAWRVHLAAPAWPHRQSWGTMRPTSVRRVIPLVVGWERLPPSFSINGDLSRAPSCPSPTRRPGRRSRRAPR